MDLDRLSLPIVQAPMAGGPSTPALAAAVSQAGALGFLAAGYRTVDAVAADLSAVRELTPAAVGVNIFSPPAADDDAPAVRDYGLRMRREARRYGVRVGEPHFDDDDYAAKLDLLIEQRVPIVSFTFGCPTPDVVARLHGAGADVWVTITTPDEARQAQAAHADALVVQGLEAGGHRGSFADPGGEQVGLLVLLRLVAAATSLPLVGAGGIMDGPAVAAALCAGAAAAQLGTALMLTPEAATWPAHRAVLPQPRPTRLTRAFSGRLARGMVNRFMDEHDAEAPSGYPQVAHITGPIRAAAARAGDAESINLWAGQGHTLARSAPAAELVRTIAAEASEALEQAGRRLAPAPQAPPRSSA
jgi:nitronate monooxygenase